jgi:hypothetical protein
MSWGPLNSFRPSGPASNPNLPQLPKLPWTMRATRKQMTVAAVVFAASVFALALVVDLLLYRAGVPAGPMFAVSDAAAAVIAALFALRLIRHATERVEAVHGRLRMVAEMNHHIRNALDIIQLSAHATKDQQAIAAIDEEVTRISWALREIMGNGEPPVSGAKPE